MGISMKPDGVDNFVTAIVSIVADTVAVLLRVLAKRKTKRFPGSDDYWMIVSLLFFYGWAGLILYCELPSTLDVFCKANISSVAVSGIDGTLEILQMTDLEHIQRVTKVIPSIPNLFRSWLTVGRSCGLQASSSP